MSWFVPINSGSMTILARRDTASTDCHSPGLSLEPSSRLIIVALRITRAVKFTSIVSEVTAKGRSISSSLSSISTAVGSMSALPM